MNGIDKITKKLEAEAQAEIDALNVDAKAERDGILADLKAKAQAEYDARIKAGERDCALRAERLQSAAEMEAKKQLLAFKQEAVSRVFELAAKRLVSLPKEDYVKFLASQAAQAGGGELIFSAKDAKKLGAEVVKAANAILGEAGKATLSKETRPISGGVIVKQGNVETNCSVDMLVQLRRNDLSSHVAELLFA